MGLINIWRQCQREVQGEITLDVSRRTAATWIYVWWNILLPFCCNFYDWVKCAASLQVAVTNYQPPFFWMCISTVCKCPSNNDVASPCWSALSKMCPTYLNSVVKEERDQPRDQLPAWPGTYAKDAAYHFWRPLRPTCQSLGGLQILQCNLSPHAGWRVACHIPEVLQVIAVGNHGSSSMKNCGIIYPQRKVKSTTRVCLKMCHHQSK